MEDINEIIKQSKEIIKGLEDGNNVKPLSDPDSFRTTLLAFMENQMSSVQNKQGLLDLVDAEIIKKLVLHELDITELRQLRNDLMSAGTYRLSAILEPFKATNTTPNPLISPPPVDGGSKNIAEDLTPVQRQALAKLASILELANSKVKKDGDTIDDLPE